MGAKALTGFPHMRYLHPDFLDTSRARRAYTHYLLSIYMHLRLPSESTSHRTHLPRPDTAEHARALHLPPRYEPHDQGFTAGRACAHEHADTSVTGDPFLI